MCKHNRDEKSAGSHEIFFQNIYNWPAYFADEKPLRQDNQGCFRPITNHLFQIIAMECLEQ